MIRQSAAVLFFVFAYSAFGALSVRDCGVREGLFGVDVRVNTEAIAKAVERCAAESLGEVRFPAGLWRTGPIHLRSK